jgi:UDP-2-acetamido-2,6-beta-L-arabino-hexul-4-ose reductase
VKIAITGGEGFLGWHTACRLRALHGVDPVRLGREAFTDPDRLATAVWEADVVMHVAGVNRASSDEEVRQGNVDLAIALGDAISAGGKPVRVVYANSIQADRDNPYGRGKAAAAEVLRQAVATVRGTLVDVLLPNLFGEHGRPNYNSFVATFCDAVSHDQTPTVADDKTVPLLHAQRAASELISAAMDGGADATRRPQGEPRLVSQVLTAIQGFHEMYSRGDIPDLTDDFNVDLFNTYRSYTFPQRFPMYATVHADERGALFETVRSHGGTGQSFVSTTRPGRTRGDHYHLRKVERFYVVHGEAEIALRRLLGDEVVTFRIGASRPGYVDMPTLWVHNITNVGDEDLVTVFWADQLLDPVSPDQYPERVVQEAPA